MELGLFRREALQNLQRRTDVPELSNPVLLLTQTDTLGIPIRRVLKRRVGEMRAKRRQWGREKVAKLPVNDSFDPVPSMFPPVLMVELGRSYSEIGGTL